MITIRGPRNADERLVEKDVNDVRYRYYMHRNAAEHYKQEGWSVYVPRGTGWVLQGGDYDHD